MYKKLHMLHIFWFTDVLKEQNLLCTSLTDLTGFCATVAIVILFTSTLPVRAGGAGFGLL